MQRWKGTQTSSSSASPTVKAFGITVGVNDFWGTVYGTEATRLLFVNALGTLNLNRVWLHVNDYMERVRRIFDRLGFRPDGTLRQHSCRDGRD